uniref:CSON002352 protein n=1 Tax=Culicoides sonorensis TaxID=179676 RepID=A0A336L2R6_CULSO
MPFQLIDLGRGQIFNIPLIKKGINVITREIMQTDILPEKVCEIRINGNIEIQSLMPNAIYLNQREIDQHKFNEMKVGDVLGFGANYTPDDYMKLGGEEWHKVVMYELQELDTKVESTISLLSDDEAMECMSDDTDICDDEKIAQSISEIINLSSGFSDLELNKESLQRSELELEKPKSPQRVSELCQEIPLIGNSHEIPNETISVPESSNKPPLLETFQKVSNDIPQKNVNHVPKNSIEPVAGPSNEPHIPKSSSVVSKTAKTEIKSSNIYKNSKKSDSSSKSKKEPVAGPSNEPPLFENKQKSKSSQVSKSSKEPVAGPSNEPPVIENKSKSSQVPKSSKEPIPGPSNEPPLLKSIQKSKSNHSVNNSEISTESVAGPSKKLSESVPSSSKPIQTTNESCNNKISEKAERKLFNSSSESDVDPLDYEREACIQKIEPTQNAYYTNNEPIVIDSSDSSDDPDIPIDMMSADVESGVGDMSEPSRSDPDVLGVIAHNPSRSYDSPEETWVIVHNPEEPGIQPKSQPNYKIMLPPTPPSSGSEKARRKTHRKMSRTKSLTPDDSSDEDENLKENKRHFPVNKKKNVTPIRISKVKKRPRISDSESSEESNKDVEEPIPSTSSNTIPVDTTPKVVTNYEPSKPTISNRRISLIEAQPLNVKSWKGQKNPKIINNPKPSTSRPPPNPQQIQREVAKKFPQKKGLKTVQDMRQQRENIRKRLSMIGIESNHNKTETEKRPMKPKVKCAQKSRSDIFLEEVLKTTKPSTEKKN